MRCFCFFHLELYDGVVTLAFHILEFWNISFVRNPFAFNGWMG